MTTLKTSFRLTGWNTTQLRLRVPAILTAYGKAIDAQFKEEIRTVQYEWVPGRLTYRKNGTIEGSPRDIVDLGGFIRSQRRDRVNATTLRFSWNVPYASLIFTGYTTYNKRTGQSTTLPPRNWIEPALKAQPLDRFFADQWKALARRSL
jgi:hypothetical protein